MTTMTKKAAHTDDELRTLLARMRADGVKLSTFAENFARAWTAGTHRNKAFTPPVRKFAKDLVRENGYG